MKSCFNCANGPFPCDECSTAETCPWYTEDFDIDPDPFGIGEEE